MTAGGTEAAEPAALSPDHPGSPRPSRRRCRTLSLLALMGYLLFAAWLDSPTLVDPLHKTVAGSQADGAIFLWFLASTSHAVMHGDLQAVLVTHNLNFPAGVNAMWNTGLLLPAVLLAPVTATAGPAIALLLVFLLGPPLSAWSAYLASAPFVKGQSARFVAGLVFGFSPAVMAAQLGQHFHLSLLMLVPPIMVLATTAATGSRPPRRTGLLLGFALACQLLIGEEVLALAAIGVAVVLAVLVVQHRHSLDGRLPAFARTACWALLPFLAIAGYPLAVQLFGPQRVHGNLQAQDRFNLDPLQVVVPTRLMRFQSPRLQHVLHPLGLFETEKMGYLGIPLLIVLTVVAIRYRRDRLVRTVTFSGLILAGFSVGLTLHVGGRQTNIPMPWRIIGGLPLLGNLLPGRFMLIIDLLVALLLALAIDRLPVRPRRRGFGLLAIGICLLSLLPLQTGRAQPPGTPAFFTAAGRQLHGTVLVLPYPAPLHASAMTWVAEAGAGFAIPGGYFVGPDENGRASFGTHPARPSIKTLAQLHTQPSPLTPTAHDRAQLWEDLTYWHADTIVLGPSRDQQLSLSFLSTCLRRTPQHTDGVYIWRHVLATGVQPAIDANSVNPSQPATG